MSNVYGYPVWPLQNQPNPNESSFVPLTSFEEKENSTFIASKLYRTGFSYRSCLGLLSAIYQESECNPCMRERKATPTAYDGMGLLQVTGSYSDGITTYQRLEDEVFNPLGFYFPGAWMNVVQNMSAQTAYINYRLRYGGWFKPYGSLSSYFYVYQPFEMPRSSIFDNESVNVAGAFAVMNLHPGAINQIYYDANFYFGQLSPAEQEPLAWRQNPQRQAWENQLRYLVGMTYARSISLMQSYFTEQQLKAYNPPKAKTPFIYYLKPHWKREGN